MIDMTLKPQGTNGGSELARETDLEAMAAAPVLRGFLGTGFGDRFKVLQGGSGLFGEEVLRVEEPGVMQGNPASKRCFLAV